MSATIAPIKVTQNNARTGQLDCHSAAKKKADANCAADREHRQLPLIEPSTKFLRSDGDSGIGRSRAYVGSSSLLRV